MNREREREVGGGGGGGGGKCNGRASFRGSFTKKVCKIVLPAVLALPLLQQPQQ